MGWFRTFTFTAGWVAFAGAAHAQDPAKHAEDWQLGLHEAVTPVMHEIRWFHDDLLMPIITVISLFVMALLLYIMVRFRESANPTPSKTSHNTLLEVLWTAVPILILVVIAIPSFRILYLQDKQVDADMTLKAIGNQWYWTYEYPDHDSLTFDANMIEDEAARNGRPRLLATDQAVVVPVNTTVRVLVTATDVIHNWAVPAFGMKVDAVPGRINESWFRVEKVGTYYGQCSELCGSRHAFMPIEVRVVSQAEFETWLQKAKEQFATAPTPTHVAAMRDEERDRR